MEGVIAADDVVEVAAIHHRHHQIEQNEIGQRSSAKVLERFLAVLGGLRRETFLLEPNAKRFDQIGIVVHDEDGLDSLIGLGVPVMMPFAEGGRGLGVQRLEVHSSRVYFVLGIRP